MSIKMYIMSENIDTILLEKQVVQGQLDTCSLAQRGAKASIERQNNSILVFKQTLAEKNKTLASIARQNKVLHVQLQDKIILIGEVENATCGDTINWMLEEAIEDEEDLSYTVTD
jgi:hypothetical protein